MAAKLRVFKNKVQRRIPIGSIVRGKKWDG
jgi:hypothetical protein